MKKKYIIAVIALLVIIAGMIYFLAGSRTFINPDGGYSFIYPADWKAAVNQYDNANSLFGPNASSTEGLGGVEVFPNQTSIEDFLGGVAAQYTNKAGITVDGVSGVRADYDAFPMKGEQITLLKEGKIYNIYVGSRQSGDVDSFNQIVSTFKFTQ